jgi:hypothetical protein
MTPGGGGSTQSAPDTIVAGEAAVLRLELTVWGAGGSSAGRNTDTRAFYNCLGSSDEKLLTPNLVSQADKQEVYEFTIPPLPKSTDCKFIEYRFESRLDGHLNLIKGMKTIRVMHR